MQLHSVRAKAILVFGSTVAVSNVMQASSQFVVPNGWWEQHLCLKSAQHVAVVFYAIQIYLKRMIKQIVR